MKQIGIIVAVEDEIPDRYENLSNVSLVVSGIGAQNAFDATKKLCRNFNPELILCLGICGGVNDGISKVGHLIVADKVGYRNHEIEILLPFGLKKVLQNLPYPYRTGKLGTHKNLVTSMSQVKDEVAVDQEGYFVVKAAGNIPCLVVKSISDIIISSQKQVSVKKQLAEINKNFETAKQSLNLFYKACITSGPL